MKGTQYQVFGVCPICSGEYRLRGECLEHHRCALPGENTRLVWNGDVLPEIIVEVTSSQRGRIQAQPSN